MEPVFVVLIILRLFVGSTREFVVVRAQAEPMLECCFPYVRGVEHDISMFCLCFLLGIGFFDVL